MPYVYVIDLGATVSVAKLTAAMDLAKIIKGIDMECYVGLESEIGDASLTSLMVTCDTKIVTESERGDIRTAYFTAIDAATDEDLIALNTTDLQKSRIFIAEPLLFGKTCARISVTPYDTEPGFLKYRTVEPGTFTSRSSTQEIVLQNAGIVFNKDEKVYRKTYCRINLCVSTAFGKPENERPNDALLHARYNADHCIRRCITAIYPQIKANETATNLVRCQTLVDRVVDEEIEAGAMMKGSKVTLKESETNAYLFTLESSLIPVNHTNNIDITVYVGAPSPTVIG